MDRLLVSLALSPDGNVVACGSQDKSVHFWRRSNGQDSMMTDYPWKPSELAFSLVSCLLLVEVKISQFGASKGMGLRVQRRVY